MLTATLMIPTKIHQTQQISNLKKKYFSLNQLKLKASIRHLVSIDHFMIIICRQLIRIILTIFLWPDKLCLQTQPTTKPEKFLNAFY